MKKTYFLLALVGLFVCGCNNHAEETGVDTISEFSDPEVKGEIIARHGRDVYSLFDGGYGKNVIFRYKYNEQCNYYDQLTVFKAEENKGEFYGKYDEITNTKCIDEGIIFVLNLNILQETPYQNEIFFISYDTPDKVRKIYSLGQVPEINFFDDYLTYDELIVNPNCTSAEDQYLGTVEKRVSYREILNSSKSEDCPWLEGDFVYETIDPTMYEIVINKYHFSQGTYVYSRSVGDSRYSEGNLIPFTIQNGYIYNDEGEQVFKINNNNHTLFHIHNEVEYKKRY